MDLDSAAQKAVQTLLALSSLPSVAQTDYRHSCHLLLKNHWLEESKFLSKEYFWHKFKIWMYCIYVLGWANPEFNSALSGLIKVSNEQL